MAEVGVLVLVLVAAPKNSPSESIDLKQNFG
jgi:hypothetical protein